MKNIKLYEEFLSEHYGENTPGMKMRKTFNKPTEPKEPFKRDFTAEERKAMHDNFPLHSWSKIDSDGKIVLGGGEESRGKFYITEDDLKKLTSK